ncbi:MAG: hypothetical protein R2697_03010 [Ilumatobacteraceae bacterium]
MAAHVDGDVLVLSEFTGAADELGEALPSTPRRSRAQDTIVRRDAPSRTPPRMEAMRQRIESSTVSDWAKSFLDVLIDPS